MSTESREVIYGGRIIGAKIRAADARQRAAQAAREADRAAAELWSIQMEAYGGPAQPSPTIGQCLNGGYSCLEVKCHWVHRGNDANDPFRTLPRTSEFNARSKAPVGAGGLMDVLDTTDDHPIKGHWPLTGQCFDLARHGKNGDMKTVVVSTYVVEKGKPLATPA